MVTEKIRKRKNVKLKIKKGRSERFRFFIKESSTQLVLESRWRSYGSGSASENFGPGDKKYLSGMRRSKKEEEK